MGRVNKKRILHLAVSLKEGDGGIASVSRAMVSAMQSWPEVRCDIRALEYREGKLRFIAKFLLAVIEHQPDLIVVDHLHLTPLVYLTRWYHRTGYALFCHGKEMDEKVTWLRKLSLGAAKLRIANSNFTANRLAKKFGLSFHICFLGLDPSLEKTKAKLKSREGNVVLIVGRMDSAERYKGHDQLIEAISQVRTKIPDVTLTIVGGGNDIERLKNLAKEKNVETNVNFTGWVATEAIADKFAECSVFAMPSKNEGFGLTYIEAMRFAKPVIASKLDGALDVVQDGVSGYLVDPDDIPVLANKLCELLKDAKKAQSMGDAGRRRYETFFTHSAFAKRFQNILASILIEKKSRPEGAKNKAA